MANDGTKLMPTTNIKKVRKLLKSNRAKIICHHPFTIQLLYQTAETNVQPIELGMDAGYQTIGISIKSEKHEFVSAEYELLKDEVEHHHDKMMYRKTRRNRLRYRAPRFKNRRSTKKDGWLAPSIRNKVHQHLRLVNRYMQYMPIVSITIETAQFDTQLVETMENGVVEFSGKDYQHGRRYLFDTLREAVFARDNYTCQICKKSAIRDKLILETHHIGYRRNDRSDRMNNLLSVCIKCHTPRNHKEGGKLYDLKPKLHKYSGMAFMNNVKWKIYNNLKETYPTINIHLTNGVITKRARKDRNIQKTHANDAYCIGCFYPAHRSNTLYYKKKRRNNRILSKFYDAKYIDIRDGSIKSGQQLSTNRTDRSVPKNNPNNERIFRGCKISKGRYSIRTRRYSLQPYDLVQYNGQKYQVKGIQNNGDYIGLITNGKPLVIKTTKVIPIYHSNGWVQIKKLQD
jgi:hypothetical protein